MYKTFSVTNWVNMCSFVWLLWTTHIAETFWGSGGVYIIEPSLQTMNVQGFIPLVVLGAERIIGTSTQAWAGLWLHTCSYLSKLSWTPDAHANMYARAVRISGRIWTKKHVKRRQCKASETWGKCDLTECCDSCVAYFTTCRIIHSLKLWR